MKHNDMTVAFVVCEYNPFHNGHAYHLARTRAELSADVIVCVMSGHFTQRGTPSVSDKWSRTRMALRGGADLVLELHPIFACSSAESFASGALLTAASLGIDAHVSFGAECNELAVLNEIADVLVKEPAKFREPLAELLGQGQSFAAARSDAAALALGNPAVKTLMKSSNNILALEYIKAIRQFGLPLRPFIVKRMGAGYLDRDVAGYGGKREFSSATALRLEIWRHYRSYGGLCLGSLLGAMPQYSAALMLSEFEMGRGPVFEDDFFNTIITLLRRLDTRALAKFPDVREGLEMRVKRAATGGAADFNELLNSIATRRYPASSITRLLFRVLLGFDREAADARIPPPYIRALGFNERGRELLRLVKPTVPIVTNMKSLNSVIGTFADDMSADVTSADGASADGVSADGKSADGVSADGKSADGAVCGGIAASTVRRFLELDLRATDIYMTALKIPSHRVGGQDYLRSPVILF